MTPRLKAKFKDDVAPKLDGEFKITNKLARPKLEKIVLNVGMGRELDGTKVKAAAKDQVLDDLMRIAGQKPVMIASRKSVSNFKVREGYLAHAMVTLRGDRMWEFLDRLVSIAIPRVKDFRGLSAKSFDPSGNYSFGIQEQGIFPEINMAEAQYNHGMNINIVLKNSDPAKSRFLLTELGWPFEREEDK